ncbi:MAG: hypothetical protein HGA45_43930 [Chloroflexales bacterium]|nr:hypothetical protein [Chloroflexales bacterium]
MTEGSTPPAAPVPAAPPKKRGPLARIAVGCLGVVVLGCVLIGGFMFYETWQQEQNYKAGHAAYLQADCASAAGPLGKAASGDPGSAESDVALKAAAELQECEAFEAAEALVGEDKLGDAVMGYSAFVVKYADSPLNEPALTRGQALVADTEPAALISADLCQAIDDLVGQQLISAPDDQLPPILYACGQAYEGADNFSEALRFYERFRGEYPDHSLTEEVRVAFVRATVSEAAALGAGALPAPQSVGASGESGGNVTVLIQNDSAERLSMVFSGPEVRVEELEPCAECSDFSGSEPTACPELGPVGRYVMAPGTYDVVVKASGNSGVTPFRGTWTLEPSQEYSSCFYLVTTSE